MKRSMRLFFMLCLLPTLLFAQRSHETYLSIGLNSSNYGDDWDEETDVGKYSMLAELQRSWNKKDNLKYSLVKQLGVGVDYFDLSDESGGIGAHTYHEGFYSSIRMTGGLFLQIRFSELARFRIGSRVEGNVIGYESNERTGWGWPSSDGQILYYSGNKKIREFNRDYFDQLYYGPDIKFLFKSNIEDDFTIGFNFSFLFTKPTESNFETKNRMRFAVFIML